MASGCFLGGTFSQPRAHASSTDAPLKSRLPRHFLAFFSRVIFGSASAEEEPGGISQHPPASVDAIASRNHFPLLLFLSHFLPLVLSGFQTQRELLFGSPPRPLPQPESLSQASGVVFPSLFYSPSRLRETKFCCLIFRWRVGALTRVPLTHLTFVANSRGAVASSVTWGTVIVRPAFFSIHPPRWSRGPRRRGVSQRALALSVLSLVSLWPAARWFPLCLSDQLSLPFPEFYPLPLLSLGERTPKQCSQGAGLLMVIRADAWVHGLQAGGFSGGP